MTATQMVLVYDVRAGKLSQQETFEDADTAADAFSRLEREFRNRTDIQVVMLSGESADSIKTTHGSYFREPFSFLRELDREANGGGSSSSGR